MRSVITLICFYTPFLFASNGIIKPNQSADISAQLNGMINSVHVKLGDTVKKDQIIATFECGVLQAEKQKAKAEYESTQAKLVIDLQLLELNSIGQESVASDKSKRDQALANLNISKISVNYCQIIAPFDGKVDELNIKPFDVVKLNQPLLRIIDDSEGIVEFVVDGQESLELQNFSEVNVFHPLILKPVSATIFAQSPSIEPVSQTRIMRAKISPLPLGWVVGLSVSIRQGE